MEEKQTDWWPAKEEYEPEISKDKWTELVSDKNIFTENSLIAFACLKEAGAATCTNLAESFGQNKNFYNNNIWQTGERIYQKINCKLFERETDKNKFWPVCCLGKKSSKGTFIYKIRDELLDAFDETGVLRNIKIGKFTWIPFYKELAQKLLNYKGNRKRFVGFVYSLDMTEYIKKIDYSDDIDPFTFYGIFNRQITLDNRKSYLQTIKKFFNIESSVPEDFAGIPVFNNQNALCFDRNNLKQSCDFLWNVFEKTVANSVTEEDIKKILSIKGSGFAMATIPLFWVNPEKYMPMDKNTIDYLKKIKIANEDELNNPQNYVSLLDKIYLKIKNNEIKEKSIPEISFNAYKPILSDETGATTMTNENSLVKNLSGLLLHTHNLILHGAPGTGKTHLAHEIAKSMNAETEFVQFHPNYDYTDFVEGLRPVNSDEEASEIGFERKDGVFKTFCISALKNLTNNDDDSNENNFDEAWEKLLERVRNNIAKQELTKIGSWEYGLSKTESLKYSSENSPSKYQFTITKKNVFDTYSGKLARPKGGFQKDMEDVVQYLKDNFGLKDYKTTVIKKDLQKKPFLFIIDEINRGELSKIFGELFYAIDPGYRVKYEDLQKNLSGKEPLTTIRTQYANLETDGNEFDRALNINDADDFGHFFVPENVYIIGTMNDIDRSVDTMDFAFRRRFTFYEIKAENTIEMLDEKTDENGNTTGLAAEIEDEAKTRMTNLNNAISAIEGLNSSYHIGGAYFLKLNELGGDFDALWNYHLEGLLREYLRGRDDAEEKLDKLKNVYDMKNVVSINSTTANTQDATSQDSESKEN